MKVKIGLGFKISQARMQKGLSQVDLSKLLGIHKVALSRWENNSVMPEKKS